jgi:hypothetical protein
VESGFIDGRTVSCVVTHGAKRWRDGFAPNSRAPDGGGRPLTEIRGRIHHEEQPDEASASELSDHLSDY